METTTLTCDRCEKAVLEVYEARISLKYSFRTTGYCESDPKSETGDLCISCIREIGIWPKLGKPKALLQARDSVLTRLKEIIEIIQEDTKA